LLVHVLKDAKQEGGHRQRATQQRRQALESVPDVRPHLLELGPQLLVFERETLEFERLLVRMREIRRALFTHWISIKSACA
jgi:hypothetical protein